MSLNGAVANLASWAGNTMMPTMAGMFFASAGAGMSKGACLRSRAASVRDTPAL